MSFNLYKHRLRIISNYFCTHLLYFLIFIFLCHFNACQKKSPEEAGETILVNIDDRITISKHEFITRAEYTIRPAYCKHNSYLHHKIILNSLVAEKLFALEAGDSSKLLENEEFLSFIKGRKEQAMRQWMHHQEATKLVKVDRSEIMKYYGTAGRSYEVSYFSFSDSTILKEAKQSLAAGKFDFNQFYEHHFGDSMVPKRIITWAESENSKILQALYQNNPEIGHICAPIELENNDFILIRIDGWTDTKAVTQTQIQDRLDKIKETIIRVKVSELWSQKVGEIMRQKTVNFVPTTFNILSEIFFRQYFKSDQQRKDSLQKRIWDIESEEIITAADVEVENILNLDFFTIDGKTWTVADFRKELMSHPLVFRKRKMNAREFPEQFRLAVVDLLRDHYITQKAYEKKYDQVDVVRRNENMWRDAYVSMNHKIDFLNSLEMSKKSPDYNLAMITEHLNEYVDRLQKKYHKRVFLNFEEFESLNLSSIDLLVKQNNQPYPYVVPQFPILTTDHTIEYIARMKN